MGCVGFAIYLLKKRGRKVPPREPTLIMRSNAIAMWLVIVAFLVVACQPDEGAELDNAAFRDRVVAFVREVAVGGPNVACTLALTAKPIHVVVWMYDEG